MIDPSKEDFYVITRGRKFVNSVYEDLDFPGNFFCMVVQHIEAATRYSTQLEARQVHKKLCDTKRRLGEADQKRPFEILKVRITLVT